MDLFIPKNSDSNSSYIVVAKPHTDGLVAEGFELRSRDKNTIVKNSKG